ncbi:MAG: acyltransferase [Pseudomonadota bacterium]
MSDRGEVTGVQYLRGLAALAVVVNHASGTMGEAKYFGGEIWGGALVGGRIGADLFFLISGFIITIVSLKGPDLVPAVDWRSFFGRRFTRVIPLMWLAILSYAALRFAGRGLVDVADYLHAFFLLPTGAVKPQVIWTLRQELVFYLVFALSMLGPRKLRFLMILWVLSPFLTFFLGPWLPRGPLRDCIFIICHFAAFEFGAGMLLAIIWLKRSRALVIRLPFEPLIALVAAFALPLGISALLETQFNMRGGYLLFALSCVPAMFLGIHVVCPPGIGQRIGRLLGNASYSVYLFHPHILSAVIGVWARLAPATPGWMVVLGSVSVAVAGGIAVHFWVERPLVEHARGWFKRRPPPADAAH